MSERPPRPTQPALRDPFWELELRKLFAASDMTGDEFARLLPTALAGNRPDHPSLPPAPDAT